MSEYNFQLNWQMLHPKKWRGPICRAEITRLGKVEVFFHRFFCKYRYDRPYRYRVVFEVYGTTYKHTEWAGDIYEAQRFDALYYLKDYLRGAEVEIYELQRIRNLVEDSLIKSGYIEQPKNKESTGSIKRSSSAEVQKK